MVKIKRDVAKYYESTRGKYHVDYTLGQSLEVALMQWNMKQNQFAYFTSINKAQVSQYLREKRIPSKSTLLSLMLFSVADGTNNWKQLRSNHSRKAVI